MDMDEVDLEHTFGPVSGPRVLVDGDLEGVITGVDTVADRCMVEHDDQTEIQR